MMIILFLLGLLGFTTYAIIILILIIDMCNKDPFTSNWEYFKKCFKKQ